MYVSADCVKRSFRSGIGAATALRPQSRWGHASWSGGVMATPTFCHALPTARRLRRLDSLALCCDDVKTFSPEHGPCQIKFFRWSQRPMRQNEARPARTTRQGRPLWLDDAQQSGIYPMQRFARTVRRDLDAVTNALTKGWSNGQTEGHINRLKTLKRAMYGRAGAELLRARMLPLNSPSQHGK